SMNMQLSDGSEISLSDPSRTSFAGFIASSPIVSLQIFPNDNSVWATVDNLIVGASAITASAVPEPSTSALAALGAVAFIAYGWTRHRGDPHRQRPVGPPDTTQ